jgi:hypothetical protein
MLWHFSSVLVHIHFHFSIVYATLLARLCLYLALKAEAEPASAFKAEPDCLMKK